jgi:glycosyltransferase involved in cell wall biosynthesis
MSINRVVLAGVYSFPEGQAASSRILNLTRGFMDHLEDVQVISAYYEEDEKEFHRKGTYEFHNKVIPYRSIAPFLFTGTRIIERIKIRLTYYKQIQDLVDVIIEELRGDEDEMIFLYGRSYSFLSLLLKKIKNKRYKTKIIFDIVEPPAAKTSFLEYIKHPFLWESTLVFKKLLSKFDACTFITYKLHEKFGSKTNKQVIVPSILYHTEKSKDVSFNQDIITIGYLGALIGKDYPELLYAFCMDLHNKKKTFKLVIIGRFRKFAEGRTWEKVFLNSPFKDSIELHFNPNEKTKASLIKSVNFIVLFRKPEPLQAFTFPTRVVEALGFGKVPIMNDFGDLTKYFVDGENSILFSSKIEELNSKKIIKVHNIDIYSRLLTNGLDLLKNDFSASIQAKKILNLI